MSRADAWALVGIFAVLMGCTVLMGIAFAERAI